MCMGLCITEYQWFLTPMTYIYIYMCEKRKRYRESVCACVMIRICVYALVSFHENITYNYRKWEEISVYQVRNIFYIFCKIYTNIYTWAIEIWMVSFKIQSIFMERVKTFIIRHGKRKCISNRKQLIDIFQPKLKVFIFNLPFTDH